MDRDAGLSGNVYVINIINTGVDRIVKVINVHVKFIHHPSLPLFCRNRNRRQTCAWHLLMHEIPTPHPAFSTNKRQIFLEIHIYIEINNIHLALHELFSKSDPEVSTVFFRL